MIDLHFAGLDQLKRELARLSVAVQVRLARNASMAMARVVAKQARLNAPVVTGALRRSIKARRPRGQPAGIVSAYANAAAPHSWIVEYGTSRTAAKPYLRPAVDESVAEVQAKLVENLSAGIQRELAKQQVPIDQREDFEVVV